MAFSNKIELSDFSGGLITDLEAAKLPASAASTLTNADIRNKFLQTLPGITEVNTGLDASFVKISEEQFLFTSPSEQNVTLVYGTLASVDKLYVRPYLASDGTWTDSWLDLTEAETGLTADAGSGADVTDTTHIVDAGLSSTTTDYYKFWIVYNTTRSASAIVTAYDGTAKKLTLSWAITSQATGDSYFICRNPVYNTSGTLLFAPSSDGCRFLQRDNAIDIVTGSDVIYDSQTSPYKTDLHLSVKNGYQGFDDTDLNFTGFYLTRKPPASMAAEDTVTGTNYITISATTLSAGEQALDTASYYIGLLVPVYDGFQEGPLWKGEDDPFNGTKYLISTIAFTTASRKLQVDLNIFYGIGASKVPLAVPDKSENIDGLGFLMFDRRVTDLRIYLAQGASVSGTGIGPTTEWRMVKNVKVNSTDWSGSGVNYTQTVYVTGDEWSAAAGIDISDRQGHTSLKVHANANFIASAKKRVAVANVYADEKRQSFVFFSAINSDELNTPDVIPHTSFLDLSLYGIPKILGFVEADGFWVALGENKIVKIDASTTLADKNTQQRGVSSVNGTISIDNFVYFTSLEDCYRYSPRSDVAPSIMTGFVKEAWKALTTANKQAAAIGYDGNYNILVIAAGTQIYLYNIPQTFASDLAQDTQAIGGWSVYSVNTTFLKFYTAPDKSCVGIANDGKAYTLFSPNVANTMTYEKIFGEADLNIHTLRLTYDATATVTAKIFDKLKGDTYPIRTFSFPAQSIHKRKDQHKGAQVKRPRLQISAPVGTKISEIVVNPDPLTDLR